MIIVTQEKGFWVSSKYLGIFHSLCFMHTEIDNNESHKNIRWRNFPDSLKP